ncbi:MAG: hypothetical protein KC590_00380 [Nitrospira sp.]|nr:hypothetical protein [Nitrospira sp.]
MSDAIRFTGPTAILIGTPLHSQMGFQQCLEQLGLRDVRKVTTWAHVPPDIQQNHQALYFVGWDQWGPDALQWLIRFKPVQKEADSATIFLILPSDHTIDRVMAVQRGVDGFISYPYSLSNLRQKIQTVRPELAIHFPPSSLTSSRPTRRHKKQPPARIL